MLCRAFHILASESYQAKGSPIGPEVPPLTHKLALFASVSSASLGQAACRSLRRLQT